MSEDDAARERKAGATNKGDRDWPGLLDGLFSQAMWDGLSYLVIGVSRGVGTVLGWMLELLP